MVDITFETVDDGYVFAHIKSHGGMPFGAKARYIRENIPISYYISVPVEMQPGITDYLTKRCGFMFLTKAVCDGETDLSDILVKVS